MKHKILCIDDEVHNLEALERLLRKDYEVVIADSGAKGVDELKKHHFSLIISDQKMPEMTGVEFFMKALALQPQAIRILLTGYTDLESVIEAINKGQIYRYITKPWDPQELQSIVNQAIEIYQMRQTIEKQNFELKEANRELQSLDRLKTEFMLLVNHELKTPLTAIFSFVQLLSEESLNEEQKLYLGKIEKNTKRLQDLINDTLLITRLQSKSEPVKVETIDIRKVVEGTWAQLAKENPSKNITLRLISPKVFEQKIHPEFISTIIGKLLSNSFAHSLTGGDVLVELSEDDDQWLIKTENQVDKPIERTTEQLLNAFTRDEDILNHTQGAGLGLAVIQSISKLFSARLDLQIDKNTFRLIIYFPRQR
ncbi:MAG: hybrid sensor histidine kinase/response regulator [Bdellovibrionales bacterium]|nr:hybrid sensor histidine kinase/response regulator [Bdellovibrionales bacterium]